MKNTFSLFAVLGAAVLVFVSCAKDQSGHYATGRSNQSVEQTQSAAQSQTSGKSQSSSESHNTFVIGNGTSNSTELRPAEGKRGELEISGKILVHAQTTNILILSNATASPASFPSTIIVTAAPANVVVTNILVWPNPGPSTAPVSSFTIVTSAPANVVVNCGGHGDCDCKNKEKQKTGASEGHSQGASGPGWPIPIISILLGGTFGRVVIRILSWKREKFERIANEIAAIEDWVKQQLKSDFPPGVDDGLKKLWRGQEAEQYTKELKIYLSNYLYNPVNALSSGNRISEPLLDERIMVLSENVKEIIRMDRYFQNFWFVWYAKRHLLKDFFVGTGAAALTPVFLSLFSNNLFLESTNKENVFAIAIFSGYCLLAGMLGVEFISFMLKTIRALMAQAEKRIHNEK